MSDAEAFREAILRIRAGDEQAAVELVQRYEPLIRREVRLHLEDQRLRRVFDSMDVAQSVLASFFIRTAAGEYNLDCPEQLVGLLVRMTRNKLASAARKQYQTRRDTRRTEYSDTVMERIADEDPTPSEKIAHEELLEVVRQQLTFEELQIVELRADGRSWEEIATRLGGNAQARRMQLSRAIERAGKVVGLDDFHD